MALSPLCASMASGQPDDYIFTIATKFVGSVYETRFMSPFCICNFEVAPGFLETLWIHGMWCKQVGVILLF